MDDDGGGGCLVRRMMVGEDNMDGGIMVEEDNMGGRTLVIGKIFCWEDDGGLARKRVGCGWMLRFG